MSTQSDSSDNSKGGLDPKILELKYVTQKTGAIHEIQIKNLQMWGYITFNEIIYPNLEVYFDWFRKNVTYNVPEVSQEVIDSWGPKMERLNQWVQALLGDEYTVSVEINKQKIY